MAARKLNASDNKLIHAGLIKIQREFEDSYPTGAATPPTDDFFEAPDVEGKRAQIAELVDRFSPKEAGRDDSDSE